MASQDCLPLQLVAVSDDCFTFSDLGSALCADAFRISRSNTRVYIQSKEHKFLTIRGDESDFQVEDLDSVERRSPGHKFHVQMYKTSSYSEGNPVMLYVEKNQEKFMVCCCSDTDVCPRVMELPRDIEDGGHEALFYRTPVCRDMYRFRSTKYREKFLGFDRDQDHLYKLMLVEPVDQVDERCHVLQPHA